MAIGITSSGDGVATDSAAHTVQPRTARKDGRASAVSASATSGIIEAGSFIPGSPESPSGAWVGHAPASDAWVLYEHKDGRVVVSQDGAFTSGDPDWHRLYPVEVRGAKPVPATLKEGA